MKRIDLNTYYPNYPIGSFIEVDDDVASAMKPHGLEDASHARRMRYNKVISLDANASVENHVLRFVDSPEDVFLRKASVEQLQEALAHIPPTQARRIHAKYMLGKNVCEIARSEGLTPTSVSEAIARGLRNLKRYYEQRRWLP